MPVNHQHQNPTPPIRWIRPALRPETEGAERSEEGPGGRGEGRNPDRSLTR